MHRPAKETLKYVEGIPARDLKCDMDRECEGVVTHIDDKGYVYCREHGIQRKRCRRCRQLAPKELKQLKAGTPLASY